MWRSKLIYGVLLVVLFFFWILYRGELSFELFVFALVLPVLLWLMLLWVRLTVRVSLKQLTETVEKGGTIRFAVQLRNPTLIPIASAVLQLRYGNRMVARSSRVALQIPVMACNTQRITLAFTAETCGCMEVQATMLTLYDPLRLFQMRVRQSARVWQLVMPAWEELSPSPWLSATEQAADDPEYAKDRSGDDVSELFAIQPYEPGDACAHIHWKLSSKLDLLMVKKYGLPLGGSVLLLLDYRLPTGCENDAARLDAMFTTVYAVAMLLLEGNQAQRFLWVPSGAVEATEQTVTEPEQIPEILRQLLLQSAADAADGSPLGVLEEVTQCTQLLYFSPKLEAGDVNALRLYARQYPVTVFAVQDETEELVSDIDDFMCVPIRLQATEEGTEDPTEGACSDETTA